jgi:GTPase SAR1 family protein
MAAVAASASTSERVAAVLGDMFQTAAELELPAPPQALELARSELATGVYTVLVVGEAKRGKSTLVNALVGAEVVPTDVAVATNQVFRVCNAPDGYRLRFEDGTAREIAAEELDRYGSQVVLDERGRPRLDRTIRWIEVDVPSRFLPERLVLLDTPGLGSLYEAHTQITERCLPHADAVIFVLESSQPVLESELALIERILRLTPNVFFIQTKIDQHSREDWEAIRSRSEAILAERFGDRLPAAHVWPFSSRNLRRAATSEHADALMLVSRYADLAEALKRFLVSVSGEPRAAQALLGGARYHAGGREVLAGRLSALSSSGEQLAALAEQRRRFERDWGPGGGKRTVMAGDAKRALSVARQAFREALQPGGAIMRAVEDRIDDAATAEELSEVSERMTQDLVEATTDEWHRTQAVTEHRLAELLASFLEVADELHVAVEAGDEAPALSERAAGGRQATLYEQAQMSYGGSMVPLGLGGQVGAVLGFTLGPWTTLAGLAFGLVAAKHRMAQTQTVSARNEAQKLLRLRVGELQQHFFGVDLEDNRFSRVEEYFGALERAFSARVTDAIRQGLANTDAEVRRLEEQQALTDDAREERARTLNAQLARWNALADELRELAAAPEINSALEGIRRGTVTASSSERPEPVASPLGVGSGEE